MSDSANNSRYHVPGTPRYAKGDTLQCIDGEQLYKAKCLDVDHCEQDDVWMYLIHFSGWSKIYDEWIDDNDPRLDQDRIETFFSNQGEIMRKPSPVTADRKRKGSRLSPKKGQRANSARKSKSQEEVPRAARSQEEAPRAKKAKSHEQLSASHMTPLQAKKARDRERFERSLERSIAELPRIKRKKRFSSEVIQDDYELIHKQRKLIPLPHKTTVRTIIQAYMKEKNHEEGELDGIEKYFNTALGNSLLYKFERPAYADYLSSVRQEDESGSVYPRAAAEPIDLFGYPHLIRFLINFNEKVSDLQPKVDEETIHIYVQKLQKLANYLSKYEGHYHRLEEYANTAPEYHRRM